MNKFGASIREKRQARGMLLRQLSAALEIDAAILSKIERGERNAKREHIPLLAALLDLDEKELLTLWLGDKVYEMVKEEEVAAAALKVAEDSVKYEGKSIYPKDLDL